MVVNPYAKKRPRCQVSESSVDQLPKAVKSHNTLQLSKSNQTKPIHVQPIVTDEVKAFGIEKSGIKEGNKMVDLDSSFDDGGIDWNAAIKEIDKSSTSLSVKKTQNNDSLGRHKTNMPRATTPLLDRPAQWKNASCSSESAKIPKILQYSSERIQPVQDDMRSNLVKNACLSQKLNNGWSLFSHQKKAILRALLMRKMILALDMGLGKTLIGCVWARSFQRTYGTELKVICVCPVSLTKEWKRTAKEATGIEVEDSTSKNPDSNTAVMQIVSWAKVPSSMPSSTEKYVVVCDEAHSMQSLEALRTKNVLALCKSSKCIGVLLLTGTPMKNGRPANLFPLLKAVEHPFGDNQKAYETYFCDGRQKSYGRGRSVWDANGCSNLSELQKHITSHVLYMKKEDCLSGIPGQKRVYHQVSVSSNSRLQHDQALSRLATIYEATNQLDNSTEAILSAVTRVRQIGSFAKIEATVSMAKEILQSQPAVVIFSSFATVAKNVHKRLDELGWNGELLTGETPANKRQLMVDRFQEGLSPVFVSTFGAGGVGLTLTAACTIILLDRPWTPGDAQQAEDRVRRIGQTKPVTSIWMIAFDLDRQIDDILEQKRKAAAVVLQKGNETSVASAPKISIIQLLKSVLKPR